MTIATRWMLVASLLAHGTVGAQRGAKPVTKPPADSTTPSGDSVTIRVVNTDLRAAVQVIGQYLDRPVLFTGATNGSPVTLETPRPVARADVPKLLRSLL